MNKVLFNTTIQEAEVIRKALQFFYVCCTQARLGNADGIKKLSPENMKIFGVTRKEVNQLSQFTDWLRGEIENAKTTSSTCLNGNSSDNKEQEL